MKLQCLIGYVLVLMLMLTLMKLRKKLKKFYPKVKSKKFKKKCFFGIDKIKEIVYYKDTKKKGEHKDDDV